MKDITAFELNAHLQSGRFAHVYMVYGTQNLLVSECASALQKALMPDVPDFNFAKLDGTSCGLMQIDEQVEQLPQFAERRLVMVCDYSAASCSEKELDRLCEMIRSIGDDCVLVLWYLNVNVTTSPKETSVGRWKKLISAVTSNGVCVVCNAPEKNDLAKQLILRAQEQGVKLKSEDASKLISLTGTDFSILAGQVDLLCAVAQRKMITPELIDKLIEPGVETNIFNLSKCILAGNFDGAYDILEKLYLQRQEPDSILRIMQGPFIDLYRAKAAVQAGMNTEQAAALYGNEYSKPRRFLLDNAMRDCSRYSFSLLRQYIILISETGAQLHGSRIDSKIVLEELVARLCRVRREEGRR